MSADIIAVVCQKGGVGKTTTAHALTAALTLTGKRTLAIDLDAQCNLSFTAKADLEGPNVLDVLTGCTRAQDAIQHTANGDIIAGSTGLSGADSFLDGTGREYRLLEALEGLTNAYDCVVIDTPPALGILTINALTACKRVIIPAQADIYSLQGVEQLAEAVQPVKRYCNRNLAVAGILLTRYNARSILSRDVAAQAERLAAQMGTKVFRAKIREATAIREAQISQQSIFEYAPKSKVAADYRAFVREFLGG